MKLAPALALLCSCVISEPDDVVVVEQPLKGGNCDEWGCGMNSPHIDNYGFHFLYKTLHQMNPQGFAITAFTLGPKPLKLNVVKGRIIGTDGVGNVYADANLLHAQFHISYFGQPMYRLTITETARTVSWAVKEGDRFPVMSYRLLWERVSEPGKFYDVCTNPGVDDTLGVDEHHTLVFEGDVIDAEKKTVSRPDGNVINFGCAGGTLAKLHLTGHTQAAAGYGWSTSLPERQTMLKLLAADYCGDGEPFTVGGQPLTWADDQAWMEAAAGSTREANWSANGATCLNVPRLAWTDPVTYDGLRDKILAHCAEVRRTPLDWCTSTALTPDPGSHLVSANPP